MRLALAAPRDLAGAGVLRLDAVPQLPVRAPRRARLIPQRLSQPPSVRPLRVSVSLVAVADLLGQVLGQVPDTPRRILRPGEHALGVEPDPEPGQMPRLIPVSDGIKRLVPRWASTSPVAGSTCRCRCARPTSVQLVPVELDGRGSQATTPGDRCGESEHAANLGSGDRTCLSWRGGRAGRGAAGVRWRRSTARCRSRGSGAGFWMNRSNSAAKTSGVPCRFGHSRRRKPGRPGCRPRGPGRRTGGRSG